MVYAASDELTARALQLGREGEAWLADLPRKVERLASRLELKPGESLGGGTESLVIACQSPSGPSVLKLGLPGNLEREARALRVVDGRGYARLLEYFPEDDAMLVERLGGMLVDAGLTVSQQIDHLVAALEASWQVEVSPDGFMTGEEKARWHIDYVSPYLHNNPTDIDRTCLERAIDFAHLRMSAHEDAHVKGRCVLSHGDGHAWNALASEDADLAYKFVDPDGLYAERAYDLAILQREWVDEILEGEAATNGINRCRDLSDRTGESMQAIWQWGYVEQVSTYLMLLEINWPDVARQHLQVVEEWVSVTEFDP